MKHDLTKAQLEKEEIYTLYKLSDIAWNIQKESLRKGGPDNMEEINLIGDVLDKKIKATGLSNADCYMKYGIVDGKSTYPSIKVNLPKEELPREEL